MAVLKTAALKTKIKTPGIGVAAVWVVLASCSGAASALAASGSATSTCAATFDPKSVKIEWTAFKTTQKVGVTAAFKKFDVKGATSGSSVAAVLKGLSVDVDSTSVESGNDVRNGNLISAFFKLVPGYEHVNAKIRHVQAADATALHGTFDLILNLGKKTRSVPMNYDVTTDAAPQFHAQGAINVLDFGLDAPLEALHQKCYELHKGADQVSKTWPDVEIKLSAPIELRCPKT